ncbi:hypothetical protein LOTGIDRAFT_230473 [Lottia gigantea]|uniref:Sushi domain-containing protein n=1 Tax=Lottia gigantea TaxID=225164 RepID=V4AZ89_LOTGI|nr:hypothetical protein LOTGIDRAFT_230473 [Lottia gigantea]ESP03033.1 hypothetical protein LOTGIDRAFT_230473 [Lottia gigantea]
MFPNEKEQKTYILDKQMTSYRNDDISEMYMYQSFIKLLILGIFCKDVSCNCVNQRPDAECDALAAQGMCLLNPAFTNCQCSKSCYAPLYCSIHGNLDRYCDCISTAPHCDTSPSIVSSCPTTCQYRAATTCPTPAVNHVVFSAAPPYKYGDIINMTCAHGFNKVGGSAGTRFCNVGGWWYNSPIDGEAPICQERVVYRCTHIVQIPYAVPSVPIAEPGTVVTYICQEKSVKLGGGSGTHICNEAGFLSEPSYDTRPFCRATEVKYKKNSAYTIHEQSLQKLTARSSLECSLACLYNYYCIGYSFNAGVCSLNNNGNGYPQITTIYSKLL